MKTRNLLLAAIALTLVSESAFAGLFKKPEDCSLVVPSRQIEKRGNQIILVNPGTYKWNSKDGVIERCADAAEFPAQPAGNFNALLGQVQKRIACKRLFENQITCIPRQ